MRDYHLEIPKFKVDKSLGQIPEPMPSFSHFMAFIGPPGSGKSSLSTALLTQTNPAFYYQKFNHVHLIAPPSSRASMEDSPFEGHDKVYDELTTPILDDIIGQLEKASEADETSLVLIDDMAASLKDNAIRKQLEKLAMNRRHLRASVWFISQTYRSLPLSTRKLLTSVCFFRAQNMKEVESMREELLSIDKRDFYDVYNTIFVPGGDHHTFMFLDVTTGEVYNKFDPVN